MPTATWCRWTPFTEPDPPAARARQSGVEAREEEGDEEREQEQQHRQPARREHLVLVARHVAEHAHAALCRRAANPLRRRRSSPAPMAEWVQRGLVQARHRIYLLLLAG